MPNTDLTTRTADLRLDTFNSEKRTVEVVFATEAPVRRRNYNGQFDEILAISKDSIIADRLNGGSMSLLDSHDSWSMKARLGVVLAGSLRIEGGKALATVQLSKVRAAELLADLADGMPFPVSVGYRIHSYTESDDEIPVRTAVKWEPFELSAVPVPADAGASSRAATKEEPPMPASNSTRQVTPTEARRALDEERQTRHQDRANVDADIISLGKRFGFEAGSDLVRGALKDGKSYADFREQLMDKLDAEDEEIRTNHAGALPLSGRANFNDQVEDALIAHLGGTPTMAENPLRSRSPLEIGRAFFEAIGIDARSLTDTSIAQAMTGRPTPWLQSRSLSTGDFPMLLENSIRKTLMERFTAQASVLKALSRERTAKDFRKMSLLRRGENPKLLPLGENGEILHGALSEERDALQIASYARAIDLSFHLLVNDDLGAFADLVEGFADAAAETEGDKFYDVLSGHAAGTLTMDDGTPAFHASRSNLGVAAALSVTSLDGARVAMRRQTSVEGDRKNGVVPEVLLVGPELETTAEKIVAEIQAATVDDVNPFSKKLKVAVEDRLDGTGWFLFGSPSSRPVLTHAYLDGYPGPQVERTEAWEVLGSRFRCHLHFGCALLDWRAAYHNPGA
ncbi:MAG: hypothetical protein K8H74_01365 [Notoacmeibacter sp.]|nr:hypothetical protein [Notoacmeibacter sp.]